ncbi:MAG: hydroxymethylglutaryl-CoA reductase, partial [Anaerolineales bacterium]|nr:hydroxymethylglutaryl-CoA reductase [Anaerolineales bacterium]
EGVRFALKNRLSDATILKMNGLKINGEAVDLEKVTLMMGDGNNVPATAVSADNPLEFNLRQIILVHVADMEPLDYSKHTIDLSVEAEPFGTLAFDVEDSIKPDDDLIRIPRNKEDNYSEESIKARQKFVEEFSGHKFEHITHYSFDPHTLQGNVENFSGVAQIPIGFAGPIKIDGEYAQGEFIVPLATTEGTLVASYNRGMKLLNLSGGVRTTIIGDAMQRAPVFVFSDARGAREFVKSGEANIDKIREEAEDTSSVAKLQYIDYYLANKFAYLRFNYSTGDAAGQNMVGRATFAACSWILDSYDHGGKLEHFFLESNLATDKKASQVNIMRTRGKRVVAEATIPRDVLVQNMRVTPENLTYHAGVANVGAILSGANNNGLHSANGITAMFIATGQDVANVSESSAGIIYVELTPKQDLYISITIPSLIIATYGGGTGLATQKECLEMMGCFGRGKVNKLAEIIAAVVLAGELSLGSA